VKNKDRLRHYNRMAVILKFLLIVSHRAISEIQRLIGRKSRNVRTHHVFEASARSDSDAVRI